MASDFFALDQQTARPAELARFWAALLGRRPVETEAGILLPGDATQVALRFVPGEPAASTASVLHLHLTSTSPADRDRLVAAVLALGGEPLDVGQRPEERHVVLTDLEGQALCVIEPGNRFLAGCGRLGEVACDGSREVGVFWSAALGWPLVWDEGEETAVQPPLGGTKIAWGGASEAPPAAPARHWFALATGDDLGAEVDRLVSLGAARVSGPPGGVAVLADPDGRRFTLSAR